MAGRFDYILGLDLGASSLGWAVIEADERQSSRGSVRLKPLHIRDAGVRIFEAGVEGDIEAGKDSSRAAQRREARQPRRQQWRRQFRMKKLFKRLQELDLLPPSTDAKPATRKTLFDTLDAQLREKHLVPDEHDAQQKLPYLLRVMATSGPVEPYELGRSIYHLAQRRGFQGSRKGGDDDDEGVVKGAIHELDEKLDGRTLAEYFVEDLRPTEIGRERIRRRYTGRSQYKDEFQRIRTTQAGTCETLDEQAWDDIEHIIFFQRPLKSAKHLIGKCELETDSSGTPLRRCPEALPIYQDFRILQMVNNLRLRDADGEERPLDHDERHTLIGALTVKSSLTWKQARKLVDAPKASTFTIEEWEPRLIGHRTNATMMKAFGDEWLEMADTEREEITLEVLHYRKPSALRKRAKDAWGRDNEQADALVNARLEEGHGRHSKQALENLLAAMQDGTTYATARKALYPDQFEVDEIVDVLPPVNDWDGDIRNPAVIRALTELRKVVNAIIRKYGKPVAIRIEMARDLKNSRDRRKKLWSDNNDRRRRREKAVEAMLEQNLTSNPNRRDIEKWRLAEECNWQCPYCGKSISAKALIGDHAEFNIEHFWPRRYLDDSYTNKTIACRKCNDKKGDRTPFDAFGNNESKWEEIVQRVEQFRGPVARAKLARVKAEEIPDDFVARHLNDTRYNTTVAANYLATSFGGRSDEEGRKRIYTPTGQLTGTLRYAWQMNGILSQSDEKTRDDHRHHAVDAIVVAVTDDARVKALSEAAADAEKLDSNAFLRAVKLPWVKFLQEAEQAIDAINVSHRTTRTIAGPMHAESIYSKQHVDEDGKPEYRIRKALHKLTAREVSGDQIVDPRIRAVVQAKYNELGGKNPAKVFADDKDHPFTTTEDGRQIPIHRVRVRMAVKPRSIGKGVRERNVASGKDSNFASMVYAVLVKDGNEKKWEHEIITRMDAYLRFSENKGKPGEKVLIPDEQNGRRRFKFALVKNDMLLLEGPDGEDVLYRVQKLSKSEIRLCRHNVTTVLTANQFTSLQKKNPDRKYDKVQWQDEGRVQCEWNRITSIDNLRKRNARPVLVTPIGEVGVD